MNECKAAMQGSRNSRFATLYKDTIDDFIDSPHIVIGCGAIGGPIIRTLGQIGVKYLHLWDHDIIEQVNLGPQGFPENSIDMNKVTIRQKIYQQYHSQGISTIHNSKFQKRAEHPEHAYWYLCVDDLDAREFIYKIAIAKSPVKIIDTRMSGLIYQVYCPDVYQKHEEEYINSIQWARDNPVEESCTSRSTPHCSMIAASIAINMALTSRPPFLVKGNMMTYEQEVQW